MFVRSLFCLLFISSLLGAVGAVGPRRGRLSTSWTTAIRPCKGGKGLGKTARRALGLARIRRGCDALAAREAPSPRFSAAGVEPAAARSAERARGRTGAEGMHECGANDTVRKALCGVAATTKDRTHHYSPRRHEI